MLLASSGRGLGFAKPRKGPTAQQTLPSEISVVQRLRNAVYWQHTHDLPYDSSQEIGSCAVKQIQASLCLYQSGRFTDW